MMSGDFNFSHSIISFWFLFKIRPMWNYNTFTVSISKNSIQSDETSRYSCKLYNVEICVISLLHRFDSIIQYYSRFNFAAGMPGNVAPAVLHHSLFLSYFSQATWTLFFNILLINSKRSYFLNVSTKPETHDETLDLNRKYFPPFSLYYLALNCFETAFLFCLIQVRYKTFFSSNVQTILFDTLKKDVFLKMYLINYIPTREIDVNNDE